MFQDFRSEALPVPVHNCSSTDTPVRFVQSDTSLCSIYKKSMTPLVLLIGLLTKKIIHLAHNESTEWLYCKKTLYSLISISVFAKCQYTPAATFDSVFCILVQQIKQFNSISISQLGNTFLPTGHRCPVQHYQHTFTQGLRIDLPYPPSKLVLAQTRPKPFSKKHCFF